MNRKLVLIISLFISTYCLGQNPNAGSTDYDTIPNSQIIVGGYPLLSSKTELSKLFKRADSITRDTSGMGDCVTTKLYIKKSIIYFCDTTFDEFELKDNSLTLSIKGIRYKVGDNADNLKKYYAKWYAKRNKPNNNETDVTIYNYTDYVQLRFILNNKGIITCIGFYVDNS
ncbi:MAG TPA: hypothetical protein VNY36_00535 [Bacteroidia bacterium]|jgi:hypothetical protein|nr:hypothetical protein [Bacteroidia bacterium]